jgi:hypothetical protein
VSELPADAALPPAAEPAPQAEAATGSDDKAEKWDFAELQASRHRMLWWTVPLLLAGAAFGSYFGLLAAPTLGQAHLSVAENLKAYAMVAGGFGVLFGIMFSLVAVWPAPLYGPRPAPKPKPLWLIILILIGCWLAAFPFSLICLILLAIGIDAAVRGAWVAATIGIAIGLLFGGAATMLVAGSGVAAGQKIRPGGEVPESVRKSAWWGRVLFLLFVWAVLMTVAVIVFGVQGDWDNFWETTAVAIASWVGFARASSAGEMPEDAFSL